MSYQIIIKQTKTVIVVKPKEWVRIGEEPVTMEERKKSWDSANNENFPVMKESYGYSPEVETSETKTVEVYNQTVESLDIKKVIYAVNDHEPIDHRKFFKDNPL